MDQIREWLYIGKYKETKNEHLLARCNISAMLLLAELVEHAGIDSLYVPAEDGEVLPTHFLRQGVDFVTDKYEQEQLILVACGAGISRSATFTIAALKEIEKLTLLQAYQVVKNAHPESMPHYLLWNSLCDYYGEAVPWTELDHS
ncbi:MAG: dual specificity protein phosphatase family protein [Chloroflexi bacterium]|nr:dual specificity protein phosphatase family protein [Chloroflexota bacterium]